MRPLDEKYIKRLTEISEGIQQSEELKKYLEDEEEEDYRAFQAQHEKPIADLHNEVVSVDPLQLFEFEERLLDPIFEGLFLPRILGYAVLRGEIDDQYKYRRPQMHFQKILLAISESPYFDDLKNRVGQSIQIGFALSSNIWIANLLEEIDNKRVKQFLQLQRIDKYRDFKHRQNGYNRFSLQFRTTNFQTTEFPSTAAEMIVHYGTVKKFLEYRITSKSDHTNYTKEVMDMLCNPDLVGTSQYMNLLGLVVNFFALSGSDHSRLAKVINDQRRDDNPRFTEQYFEFLLNMLKSDMNLTSECDSKVSSLLDLSIDDDLSKYYLTTRVVAQKGFVHQEAMEAVREFHNNHDGLSIQNDCLRRSILGQIIHVMRNLDVEAYADYFELNKTMTAYMDIFDYQQFNQSLKEQSIIYVKKLLRQFTDKRGRDYQDIKKFVIPTFQDLRFMNEKQVLEMFKTRRKKKAVS